MIVNNKACKINKMKAKEATLISMCFQLPVGLYSVGLEVTLVKPSDIKYMQLLLYSVTL